METRLSRPRIAATLAGEIRVLAMALFRWRRRQRDGNDFTSASALAPVLLAVAAMGMIETGIVHLLLAQWSETTAWVVSTAGLLTVVYLVGLAKALHYLPTRLQSETLLVRLGHFQCFEVPYRAIATARGAGSSPSNSPETVNLAVMSAPNILIELNEPWPIVAPWGRRRRIQRVALRMDDAAGFLAALQARLPAGAS